MTPVSFGGRLTVGLLHWFGWRMINAPAPVAKAVIFVYPHTSNWDFPLGILFRYASGLPIRWVAKDTLFCGPFGILLRRIGGIPVDRRKRSGFVAQMVAEFECNDRFFLAIAPEGTRRKTDSLKSGFYRLALAAKVPLALATFDYRRREVGIFGYLNLTGDESVDLAQLAAAYADRRGKYPEKEGRIAFAEASATDRPDT